MTVCVSTRSLRKANYVIREMARYYFPLYDIGADEAYRYLSTLLICESIVFDVDRELERGGGQSVAERVGGSRAAIAEQLASEGLLDEAVERELDHLVEYARLEHRLTRAPEPAAEDLERACALRTSDIRLLHRVLVRMLGRPYEELYFDLMWPLEASMDIELDLEDYPRDLVEGSFNTLLMWERRQGAEEARRTIFSLLRRYEGMFGERLLAAPPQVQGRFLALVARYQADHPRPAMPSPAAPAACLREPRLL